MLSSSFTRREKVWLGLGILLGLVGACATLLQPWFVGRTIEAVSTGQPWAQWVSILVGVLILDLVLGATSFVVIGRVGEQVVANLRKHFVGIVVRSRLGGFRSYAQGDLMTRAVSDTAVARLAISTSLAQVVTSAFTALGCLIVMAFLDWRLLLGTLAALSVASVVSLLLARKVRKLAAQNRHDTGVFGQEVMRVVTNVSTVKACRAEDIEVESLGKSAGAARDSGNRVIGTSALLIPVMNVGTQAALAIVVAWGMSRAINGPLALADLSAFVVYLLYVVSPLVMLFMGLAELQQGRAALDRLSDLSDLDAESGGRAFADTQAGAAVVLDRVSFGYAPDAPVLTDLTFSLGRTGMTALAGPSGAGKSTVFALLERFYDPQAGTVTLFGSDARDLDLGELRAAVGLVEQDTPLMRGTVGSNLRYGAPGASAADVWHALEQAQLADVVRALPRGLDTAVGEDGLGLSGGQRQRLAIARTLLRRPRLLLLDEVTAHLDPQSEGALNRALRTIAEDCHVLVIAHRMSTVRVSDEVLFLREGHVTARGPHQRLYATNEAYQDLVDGLAGDASARRAEELLPVGTGVLA